MTKPQTTRFETDVDTDEPGRKHVVADERTQGQRQHDALAAVLDAALRTDNLPSAGGTPTTLIITMPWSRLHQPARHRDLRRRFSLSARTARLLADQADIAVCVKNTKGAVLNLYRTRRIASPPRPSR